jgi:hypothetical protein
MLKMEVNKGTVNATIVGTMPEILAELTIGIHAIYNTMPTPDAKEDFKNALTVGLMAQNSPAFKEDAADDLRIKKTSGMGSSEINPDLFGFLR